MNEFQKWVSRRKAKVTKPVKTEACEPQLTPKEELDISFERWKEEWRIPILIVKSIGIFMSAVVVMWAIAVVDIQNECYSKRECREWMEK